MFKFHYLLPSLSTQLEQKSIRVKLAKWWSVGYFNSKVRGPTF